MNLTQSIHSFFLLSFFFGTTPKIARLKFSVSCRICWLFPMIFMVLWKTENGSFWRNNSVFHGWTLLCSIAVINHSKEDIVVELYLQISSQISIQPNQDDIFAERITSPKNRMFALGQCNLRTEIS